MNSYPITLGSLLIIISIAIGWLIITLRSIDAGILKQAEEDYKNSDENYTNNIFIDESRASKESVKAQRKKYLERAREGNPVSYFLIFIFSIILISGIYLIYFGITNINIHSMIPFILSWLLMIIAVLYIPIGFIGMIGYDQNKYIRLITNIIVPSIFLVFLISSTYLSNIKSNDIAIATTITTTES
jgi:hypothetical protein